MEIMKFEKAMFTYLHLLKIYIYMSKATGTNRNGHEATQ